MRIFASVRNTVLATAALAAASLASGAPSASAEGYHAGYRAYVVSVGISDHLNMRAWPAAYSRKVGSIPHHGRNVLVQRCIVKPGESDWCKVRFRGNWGWVNSRFLARY